MKTKDQVEEGETSKPPEEVTERPSDVKDVYFEEVMEQCCGTGRWQMLHVFSLSLTWLIFPAYSMSMMFVGATPKYKCADGFAANATYDDLPEDTPRCYQLNNSTAACQSWVFDQSLYLSTVVTEWNLVCGRKAMLSMLQSLLHVGGIISSLIGGHLADRFGRRPVYLWGMVLVVACSFVVALAPNYEIFLAARFFTGFAMGIMFGATIVTAIELCGTKKRALTSIAGIPFDIGTVLVAAASYGIRTRWTLQLSFAFASLILLPSIWTLPESPRWLVLNGKFDEAFKMLKTAARWNRRQFPPEQEVRKLMMEARDSLIAREAARKGAVGGGVVHQLLSLVRTPRMRRYTLVSFFIALIQSSSFFAISFDMTQLSPSPHLAGVLQGFIGIIPNFSWPLLAWPGRRLTLVLSLCTTAAVMFLFFADENTTLWLGLGLAAKVTVGVSWGAFTVQINELLPTQLRGLAYGVTQLGLRVGAAAVPFVVDLMSEWHKMAPTGVVGGTVLLAGLAALLLPETRGRPMPESVADVERNHASDGERCAKANDLFGAENESKSTEV